MKYFVYIGTIFTNWKYTYIINNIVVCYGLDIVIHATVNEFYSKMCLMYQGIYYMILLFKFIKQILHSTIIINSFVLVVILCKYIRSMRYWNFRKLPIIFLCTNNRIKNDFIDNTFPFGLVSFNPKISLSSLDCFIHIFILFPLLVHVYIFYVIPSINRKFSPFKDIRFNSNVNFITM